MDKNIEDKFEKCIRDVLGNKYFVDNNADIDSITLVEIIIHLQKNFNVKFEAADLISLRTIASIKQMLFQILASKGLI